MSSAADLSHIEFRELTTASDLAVLPPFEHHIWGSGGDAVSVNMLVATIIEGGMAIGAFAGGHIVGAVYGFATREPDALHSHYLAVDPQHRRSGLGIELKQRQRTWCLERGIRRIRWTYDPLQLGNAHLNLVALGATGVTYHIDHYGHLGGINGSLPSDRVTVSWELEPEGPPPEPTLSIDVPPASPDDIAGSTDAALHARLHVRRELAPRIGHGWHLVGVDRAERRYHLAPTP
ncbi:MAG: GNAT family N-acetyltransferase [Ilumatobacteraceae bacterium]